MSLFTQAVLALFSATLLAVQSFSSQAAKTDDVVDFTLNGAPSLEGWVGGPPEAKVVAVLDPPGRPGNPAALYDTNDLLVGYHFIGSYKNGVSSSFLGNYTAAGVTHIRFDTRFNPNTNVNPTLRVYIFDRAFTAFAMSKKKVLIPWDTDWHTWEISLKPEDLVYFGGDALTDVGQIGLRHDPLGSGPFTLVRINSSMYFDNIVLLGKPDINIVPFIAPLILDE